MWTARNARCTALVVIVAMGTVHPGALAQEPLREGPEAFGQVLRAWATKHRIEKAVVVVRRGGKTVYRSGTGGADPDAPYPLGSLSKPITGACIATLIRDGKLSLDTTLAAALAKLLRTSGKPSDARLESVTIGQLLSHRAGLPTGKDDPAVGEGLRSYLGRHSGRRTPTPALLARALLSNLQHDPGAHYAYSNAGYLILGAIIEEATGQPYEAYCRDAVLKPRGVSGTLHPDWPVLWAYGGWSMTGADYLAFLETFDPAGGRLPVAVRTWMLSPDGKAVNADGTIWYSLGITLRGAGKGFNVWHTGGCCNNGLLGANFLAFAVRTFDGTSWFVAASPRVGGVLADLDRELWRARRVVRSWPVGP